MAHKQLDTCLHQSNNVAYDTSSFLPKSGATVQLFSSQQFSSDPFTPPEKFEDGSGVYFSLTEVEERSFRALFALCLRFDIDIDF